MKRSTIVSLALLFALALLTVAVLGAEAAPPTQGGKRIGTMSKSTSHTAQGNTAPFQEKLDPNVPQYYRYGRRVTSTFKMQGLDYNNKPQPRPELTDRNLKVPTAQGSPIQSASQGLVTSWEGMNHLWSRFSGGGNQYSGEPPDQAICTNGTYVFESVNSVIGIYDTVGNLLATPLTLNEFFGYPPEFVRPAGPFGPFVFDVDCIYDADWDRWVHIAAAIAQDPTTGDYTGKNWIVVGVSESSNPLGAWDIYEIKATNDGTDGTPNHHCDYGPCFADYPHVGMDAYGVYIMTNEFSFYGVDFNGTQIYAFAKDQLYSGKSNIPFVNFENVQIGGEPGYTAWPQKINKGDGDKSQGGSMYFVSSRNVYVTKHQDLGIVAIRNTSKLGSNPQQVFLDIGVFKATSYKDPSWVRQKGGDFPLGQCLNDTTMVTPYGDGCWNFFFVTEPPHDNKVGKVNPNDAAIKSVYYASGKLYATQTTELTINGAKQAGFHWYIIQPQGTGRSFTGKILNWGTLGVERNNLLFSSIAVKKNGKGAIVFTLVGKDHYPSAAYALFDPVTGPGPIQIAREGQAPQDGFSEYLAFGSPRPRWGDYSNATQYGGKIYLATEYIESACDLQEYVDSSFLCDYTRTSLANWSTRVLIVDPK